MFGSRDHVKKFVDYINTKHQNIRFTLENQNSFSILDIKCFRNTEKKAFETSVYKKITLSGNFTNFRRFIPMTYFQYALPMKTLMRKLSSSKKSLSEILTQKNL